jgi:hypothetical protein
MRYWTLQQRGLRSHILVKMPLKVSDRNIHFFEKRDISFLSSFLLSILVRVFSKRYFSETTLIEIGTTFSRSSPVWLSSTKGFQAPYRVVTGMEGKDLNFVQVPVRDLSPRFFSWFLFPAR